MSDIKVELSDADKVKIKNTEYYLLTKCIMQSVLDYANHEIGTVVEIKRKDQKNKVGVSRNGQPDKYLIIENDNGFIFAKRILATGGLGKNVICLTISYPSNDYIIEVEEKMADAIILDTEYDPFKDAKLLASQKNKVSRLNNKNKIMFNSAKVAYSFIKTINVGDIFYSSDTSFGSRIYKWKVSEIKIHAIQHAGDYYSTLHRQNNFIDVVEVIITNIESDRKYLLGNRSMIFANLVNPKNSDNPGYYTTYYKEKPLRVTDIK